MKKGLMVLLLSVFAVFVVYYMGPVDSYNRPGGLDFEDSSYISDSAKPKIDVFTTPDNVYRTRGWVNNARIGRTCYYSIRVVDPVYASHRDFMPLLREREFPRTPPRYNNYC